jgi:hypothetical protein
MPTVKSITDEMRALAQRVTRLAGDCSDRDLAEALDELAVELALRAAELDRRFDS